MQSSCEKYTHPLSIHILLVGKGYVHETLGAAHDGCSLPWQLPVQGKLSMGIPEGDAKQERECSGSVCLQNLPTLDILPCHCMRMQLHRVTLA